MESCNVFIFLELSLTENKIAYPAGFNNGLPSSTELGVAVV